MRITIDTEHPDTIRISVVTPQSERSATIKREPLSDGVECWIFREYETHPVTLDYGAKHWSKVLWIGLEKLGAL